MWSFKFLITFFLPLCKAFESYCPAPSQRDLRASALCNRSSSSIYSCLYDENRRIEIESCTTRADFAPPGNKYVLRGRPDFTPCAADRYQPIRLWSNASSQCIYKKAQCIGNGQIMYKNGTEESDTFCRCDCTRGYDFINTPRNASFCIPSEEDCSCYKKKCPHNGVLSPDYICTTEKERLGQNNSKYPIIVHDRLCNESIFSIGNTYLEEMMTEYSASRFVFVVIAICTSVIAVEGCLLFLLFLCCNEKDTVTEHLSKVDDDMRYLEERESNGELAIATAGSRTSTTYIEMDNENIGFLKDLEPKKELTVNGEASVTTTKCIDMDNGRIGFLKEHEPGKELTITEEGSVTTTTSIEMNKEHDIVLLEEREPKKELTVTEEGSVTTTTSIEMNKEHFGILEKRESGKELTITEKGSVSSTNSIAMNKERDIGLLEERELKKELTITEEDVCAERKMTKEKTHSTRLQDLFRVVNRVVMQKIEEEILKANLEMPHFDSAEGFLPSLSREKKEDILCISDNPVFKSSMNYGLVLLLRFWLLSNGQKAPTNDFEKMPSTNDTSIQADLSRIYLSKKDISITDLEPVGAWETVFQAVCRLGGGKVQETVPNVEEIMKKEQYSCSCKDLHKLEIGTWKKHGASLGKTDVDENIQRQLQDSSCVALVGSDKKEVNDILHHNALVFVERNNHYVILPCKSPLEIVHHYKSDRYQLFILEDPCGRELPLQTTIEYMVQHDESFKQMLQTDQTKIMITFTPTVFWKFPYSGSFFDELVTFLTTDNAVSFGSEQSTNEERSCTIQLDDWFLNDKPKHCALFATVIRNGFILNGSHFKENEITQETARFNQICSKYSLGCDQVAESLRDIPRNYVMKENNHYRIPQPMYNFLCIYFGRQTELQDLFLQSVDGHFFYERIVLESIQLALSDSFIKIKTPHEKFYFQRVINDLSRKDTEVFYSIQMQHRVYRELLMRNIAASLETGEIDVLNSKELHEIGVIRKKKSRSPLIAVCSEGYEDIMSFMLCHVHEDIRIKTVHDLIKISIDQEYPLHIIKSLIDKIYDVNEISDDSWTALGAACLRKNQELCDILISKGANIDRADIKGTTPLMLACYYGLYSTVNLLINRGADIDRLDSRQMSPFTYACVGGHEHTVQLLIDKEVKSFSTANKDGRLALVLAFEEKHYNIITLLKNKDFDLEILDEFGNTAIINACKNGDIRTVQSLITLGANVNVHDDTGLTPLLSACSRGEADMVKVLITDNNTDFNVVDKEGRTPLKRASMNGNSQVVYLLLVTNRVEIDKADNCGWTPLMSSCKEGHLKIATLLVCHNANVNHKIDVGKTPLIIAVQYGHNEIINLLLDNNADVDLDDDNGRTPLMEACDLNNDQAVSILLKKGANINKSDENGYTPLIIACRNENTFLAKILINAKADVNLADNNGSTALITSCRAGDEKTVQLLIQSNVDIEKKDKAGWTPLKSASVNAHYRIVRKLLQNNADVYNVDSEEWTSLMTACQIGNINVISLLLKNKADVNYYSKSTGDTPLIIACTYSNRKTVKKLIKNGANWKKTNIIGQSPLLMASMYGKKATVSMLLRFDVDIDVQDQNGVSPLKAACNGNHLYIVKLLVSAGASIDVVDKYGYTPLLSASEVQNPQLIDLLVQLNANVNRCTPDGWNPYLFAIRNNNDEIAKFLVIYGADQNPVSLLEACEVGYLPLIKLLLDQGHDVHSKNVNNMTPFKMVIAKRHFDALDLFINREIQFELDSVMLCNLIEVNDDKGLSALTKACACGNKDTLTYLLEQGAEILRTDGTGYSPLTYACFNGQEQNVDVFIKTIIHKNTHSLSLDAVDDNGYTPLTAAASKGHVRIIASLICNGAEVNKLDGHSLSPIMYSCQRADLPTVEVLFAKGAKITLAFEWRISPIAFAKQAEAWDVVNYFLENRVEIKHEDLLNTCEYSHNILTLACKKGYKALVEFLISDTRATLNYIDGEDFSIMMHACKMNQYEIVGIIATKDIDIDLANSDGNTALMVASLGGYTDIAEILLFNQANVNKVNNSGLTSLMLACEKGPVSIIKLLMEKGADENKKSLDGLSAFTIACCSENYEVVDFLLKSQFDKLFEKDIRRLLLIGTKTDGRNIIRKVCKNGFQSLFEILIESEENIDACDRDGNSYLMLASQGGHVEIIDTLLTRGAKIDLKNKEGWNALQLACYGGHAKSVEILLKKGANANRVDDEGQTPLMIASQIDCIDVILTLIQYGTDLNFIGRKGTSAINLASKEGHVEVVKCLFTKGADGSKSDNEGANSLMAACANGHIEIVRFIVNSKINLNLRDNSGFTALRIACDGFHDKVVDFLFQNGADIDTADNNGQTSLMSACQNGNEKMVKLLLSYHAKVNMIDVNGWTALRVACNYGEASATVRLKEDIEVSIKNRDTPSLKMHSKPQYDQIVSYLIQNDADVNLVDKEGWTCLMSACKYGPTNIVELLSRKVDNINEANNSGLTALHIACNRGDTDVVELLLRCDANVNRANSFGWTSLQIASLVGHKDVVELLLRKGADISIEDTNGWTALMSACRNGNKLIVQFLLKNGAKLNPLEMIIAREFGHRHLETLFNKLLEGHTSVDDEDDMEDDEVEEISDQRIGRINWRFQSPCFNDSNTDNYNENDYTDDYDCYNDDDDDDDDCDDDEDDEDEDEDDEDVNDDDAYGTFSTEKSDGILWVL